MRLTLLTIIPFSLFLQCQSRYPSVDNNEIISYVNEVHANGYRFEYKSGDGTIRKESGAFENGVWTVRGSVTYMLPEGYVIVQEYKAGANGYETHSTQHVSFPNVQGEIISMAHHVNPPHSVAYYEVVGGIGGAISGGGGYGGGGYGGGGYGGVAGAAYRPPPSSGSSSYFYKEEEKCKKIDCPIIKCALVAGCNLRPSKGKNAIKAGSD
ncbi:hypothetical protein LSTR_LSTR002260 [Laodelphax striatellus]|uniref:Uncharacterized protein n=1 Tax=Laodelphax striatellus TaxID=195883 RepID=A0A482XFH5_LAOST|nr:hypothetical protein LSTR_LSTR002260 [Laodelphax striatellus]